VADLFAVKGLLGHKGVKSGAEDPESLPEGEIHPLKTFRPAAACICGKGWSWGMGLSEIGERGAVRSIKGRLADAG
jgi:hypothetical protein